MTAFFSIFDYFFDLLRPASQEGCCFNCYNSVCCWYKNIGELIRSDAMILVSLTGNNYWRSSRYCEYLNRRAPLTQFFQFSSRLFSLTAHLFILCLSLIFAIEAMGLNSMYAMIIIIVGSLTISTFFISFMPDLGQSLEVLYLLDQEYISRDKEDYRLDSEGQGVSTYRSELAIDIQAIFFEENIPLS